MVLFKTSHFVLSLTCFLLSSPPGSTGIVEDVGSLQCSDEHFSQLSNRFDCFPAGIATEEACLARGCCWKRLKDNSKEPWCFYPQNYKTYQAENLQQTFENDFSLKYRRVLKSPYPNDIDNLKVDVVPLTENVLRIKIYDADNQRHESPYPKINPKGSTISETNYKVDFGNSLNSSLGFAVSRKATNKTLIDSRGVGGFIFSDQFIQISWKLGSKYVYGIGENTKSFQLNLEWVTAALFAHDQVPVANTYNNVYGVHPFYLSLEEDGKAHGVLILNSNAQEFVFQPTPALTYRTIGGILDLYFFLGENPSDVIEHYLELIGKPNLPPYWSLGFQICRFGIPTLDLAKKIFNRNIEAGVPFDTLVSDIDYMENYKDFTYDRVNYSGLPEFVDEIHSRGMRYIPILDPGIDTNSSDYHPFDEGQKLDIFIKLENGEYFEGKVWSPGYNAFPDFFHPNAVTYWTNQLEQLYNLIKYDGIWIDMNEPALVSGPSAPCPISKWDNPPYTPNIHDQAQNGYAISFKTMCMSAKQYPNKRHYDIHSLYGISETEATYLALKDILKKRSFILSRSTFVGSGFYGNHWTGDVFADWDALKQSVGDILSFNLFGIPLVGADICGFVTNTTIELCARWSQLGAFYPFSRNHNTRYTIDHDPAAPTMGPLVLNAAKNALTLRYSLLPYLYTLLHDANKNGRTVARPLFFEFPNDTNTFALDEQFLWGSALLIVPVVKEGAQSVEGYLPEGVWYTYPDFTKKFISPSEGSKVTFAASLKDQIPVLIRGGYSIVTQTPNVTTTASRLNDFQIKVILDQNGQSIGELYWDDGETLDQEDYNHFNLNTFNKCLKSTITRFNHDDPMRIDVVQIVGIKENVEKVTVDILGTKENLEHNFDSNKEVLTIATKSVKLSFATEFTICWV